jgi:hypothetical protein
MNHMPVMLIPARPIPTVVDSGVDLYPAAGSFDAGTIWRFLS